jgi:hypothetical protein
LPAERLVNLENPKTTTVPLCRAAKLPICGLLPALFEVFRRYAQKSTRFTVDSSVSPLHVGFSCATVFMPVLNYLYGEESGEARCSVTLVGYSIAHKMFFSRSNFSLFKSL